MSMVVVAKQLPFEALIKWAHAVMPSGKCGIAGREGDAPPHAGIEITGPQKGTFNHAPMTDHRDPFAGMLLRNRIEGGGTAQGKFIPTFATRSDFGMDVSDSMIKCRVL